MRLITELIQVVNTNKVKCIHVLGKVSTRKSVVQEFYEKLSQSNINSDLEAEQLFNLEYKLPANYRALRQRLIERLINTVFFIDVKQPKYNDYQKAYYNCWKNLAAAKILMGKCASDAAVQILRMLLKPAQKYDLTEIIVEASRILRLHYGSQEANVRLFDYYNKMYKKYECIMRAENLAEEYFTRLTMRYLNNRSAANDIYLAGMKRYDELRPYLNSHSSYKLHLVSRLVANLAYCSVGKYEEAITNCGDALRFFSNRNTASQPAMQIFYHQQLICFIHLKQFGKGSRIVKKLECIQQPGSINWFSTQHSFLLLAMHTQNYQHSLHILDRIKKHRKFKSLPKPLLEKFRIDEAFVFFLILTQRIALPEDKQFRFRLSKFLNEVPLLSRDKKGRNIAILVAEYIILIASRKYGKCIDRAEAIDKYCYRYLRGPLHRRSYAFIKMLLQIPAAEFNHIRADRYAARFRNKLDTSSREDTRPQYELEVIPYEDLWHILLSTLNEAKNEKARKC